MKPEKKRVYSIGGTEENPTVCFVHDISSANEVWIYEQGGVLPVEQEVIDALRDTGKTVRILHPASPCKRIDLHDLEMDTSRPVLKTKVRRIHRKERFS